MSNGRADSGRFEEMKSNLKRQGFRLTPQRTAVVKELAYSKEHPTVEQIFETVKGQQNW